MPRAGALLGFLVQRPWPLTVYGSPRRPPAPPHRRGFDDHTRGGPVGGLFFFKQTDHVADWHETAQSGRTVKRLCEVLSVNDKLHFMCHERADNFLPRPFLFFFFGIYFSNSGER